MNKYLLYGGGGLVAVIGVLVIYGKLKAPAAADDSGSVQSVSNGLDAGYYSSLTPISGGISDGTDSTAAAPTTDTSSTGGGFDLGALLTGLVGSQTQTNLASIAAGLQSSDSAVLSSINLGSYGGTSSVTHDANGTTVSVNTNANTVQALVASEYQQFLGRAPDASGLAFYSDHLVNDPNYSLAQLQKDLTSSPEYAASHPATASK